MTVDVLLTCYRRPQMAGRAIRSVLDQTYEDWRLWVMDDSGGAGLPDIAPDPRIIVTTFSPTDAERRAAVRYAVLINWAAERANADLLTYLTDDDFYRPTRLERMVSLIEEGHDVVYGRQELARLDGAGEPVVYDVRTTDGILTDAYHRVDHNSVLHTRVSFDNAGGWPTDPTLWRDADAHFWRRLTDAGYVFVPLGGEPSDVHVFHADTVDLKVRVGREPWI